MELDALSLLIGLFVSTIGLGIFVYGRRQSRAPQFVVGFILIVCPYFLPGPVWTLSVGAALIFALWVAIRLGA